eukprot:c18328_g1_i1 orf=401-1216(-)
MDSYEKGSCDEAVQSLYTLLKECPQLKPIASQKIEELTKELALKAKISEELHDVKNLEAPNPVKKIKDGFLNFKIYFKKEHELFQQLAESQHPKFMIITCSDSRVDPFKIFGLDLGEAFIVRNVANLVPPYTAKGGSMSVGSSIEYAVLHLKVEYLLVMGHSRCGGVKALMSSVDDASNKFSEFIEDWVRVGKRTAKHIKGAFPNSSFEEQCTVCEKELISQSLINCLTYPFVNRAVEHGNLTLQGSYYDFVTGSMQLWNLDFKFSDPEIL